jgi:hypothetical protein
VIFSYEILQIIESAKGPKAFGISHVRPMQTGWLALLRLGQRDA